MRLIIIDIFHIYIIAMMGTFFLICTMAAAGSFDIWKIRYMKRKPEDEIANDNETA